MEVKEHFKEKRSRGVLECGHTDMSRWTEGKPADEERAACRSQGRITMETEIAPKGSPFQVAASLLSGGKEQRECELAWTWGSFNFDLSVWRACEQNWEGKPGRWVEFLKNPLRAPHQE